MNIDGIFGWKVDRIVNFKKYMVKISCRIWLKKLLVFTKPNKGLMIIVIIIVAINKVGFNEHRESYVETNYYMLEQLKQMMLICRRHGINRGMKVTPNKPRIYRNLYFFKFNRVTPNKTWKLQQGDTMWHYFP